MLTFPSLRLEARAMRHRRPAVGSKEFALLVVGTSACFVFSIGGACLACFCRLDSERAAESANVHIANIPVVVTSATSPA